MNTIDLPMWIDVPQGYWDGGQYLTATTRPSSINLDGYKRYRFVITIPDPRGGEDIPVKEISDGETAD